MRQEPMRSEGVIHCIDVAASAASGLPLSPLEALVSSGFRLEPSEQPPHGVAPWQGGLCTECREIALGENAHDLVALTDRHRPYV